MRLRFLGIILFSFFFLAKAQDDSSVLAFTFEGGLNYQAKIEYDDPGKEPAILALGLGTIGNINGGRLAGSLSFSKRVSDQIKLSARYVQSVTGNDGALLNEIGLRSSFDFWTRDHKKETNFWLFDAYTDESEKRAQPYFGSAPFKVRNALSFDLGINSINQQQTNYFYQFLPPDSFYGVRNRNFLNVSVGPSYSRTKSYELSFQDSTSLRFYQNMRFGVNVGFNLMESSVYTKNDLDTSSSTDIAVIERSEIDFAETGLNFNKLGFGFDAAYTIYSDVYGVFLTLEVQASYLPNYSGIVDPPTVSTVSEVDFGNRLLFTPRIGVGVSLPW